jgi:hypothetical protein
MNPIETWSNNTDKTFIGALAEALKLAQSKNAQVVTPSTNALNETDGVLYVGTTGDVQVRMLGGQTITYKNVPSGSFLPIRIDRVYTGTTASDIIFLY